MNFATTRRPDPFWMKRGLPAAAAAPRDERRKSRVRRDSLRRLERLEDRTLLNASIDIDAAAALTYNMDPSAAEHLRVSVLGGTYLFASNQAVIVSSNVPGLTVDYIDPNTVAVTGITSLTVDANVVGDSLNVDSTNVSTAINLNSSGGQVTLGDPTDPAGLGALSSHVTVTGPGVAINNQVILNDYATTVPLHYTITNITVDADNGFGGLTYSGASSLIVHGAMNSADFSQFFQLSSTADGVATSLGSTAIIGSSEFDVLGASGAAGSSLGLAGGGPNTFNLMNASCDVSVNSGFAPSTVNIGNFGNTRGVTGKVSLWTIGAPPFQVNVNDQSGTANDFWDLSSQVPGGVAQLTGFSVGGSLVYYPSQIKSMGLKTAEGKENRLTIDFSSGNPLPLATGATGIEYHGGSNGVTSQKSDIVLTGAQPYRPPGIEVHNATGPGQGNINIGDMGPNGFFPTVGVITYRGLSPNSVYDTLPEADYTFNDASGSDGRVLIKDGANDPDLTNGFQTLGISSQAAPATFSDTNVANKTNITVNVGAGGPLASDVRVNYGIATPVAGLSLLSINSGAGGDEAQLVNPPPAATTSLHQSGGDDRAYVSVPGASGATATTLDGGPGFDVLTVDSGGLALTPGNFSTIVPGYTTLSGAPLTGGPIMYTSYEQVNVTNLASAPPVVTASTIHAVRGQRQDDVVAGTFTSAAPGAKAADFLATIEWGDGSQSAGVIVQDASTPSVFYVMGTHTYAENAPALTTHVIVASLGNSFTQIINGVPVTFNTPASDPVTADGAAIVANAPISVTAGSFSGFENITPSPADVFVATFTDQGGVNPSRLDPSSRYSVLINWGDGTAPLPVPASAIVQNGSSNSYTVTAPQHVYHTPGSYVVTVTVSDGGPDAVVSTATGVATIADAVLTQALSILPAFPPVPSGVLIDIRPSVGFNDANPLSKPTDFLVSIDWGDGSPMSSGRLSQPGGVGTTYSVVGSHTYADALRAGAPPVAQGPGPIAGPLTAVGTYWIHVYVQDAYGSAVNLTTTINVTDSPLTVAGGLNPSSDSGVSNSDAITNVAQPNIWGTTSEANAVVWVYATKTGGSPLLIAQVAADANGAWNVNSYISLTDGGYAIQAQAYDASGHTVSALTTLVPNLVIDTIGPKVTDLYFNNQGGRVQAGFEDSGGVNNAGVGLNQASLVDANNYRFMFITSPVKGYRTPPRFLVGGIDVQPGGTVGPQYAAIKINDGRGVRGGRYLFTVKSVDPSNTSGVQDVAGNALDGEFYSFFPSGNNVNGGDFVAELDAVHHTVHAPKTTIGTASPVTPPGRRAVNPFVTRSPRWAPRHKS